MAGDTTYLTKEGLQKLQEELVQLKGPRRAELAQRLRFAIEQGDISENADYSAAKEEQAFVEGRIIELESVLANVKLIDDIEHEKGVVNIGSTVTIQEGDEEPEEYRIVGTQEANPFENRISFKSPIGAAVYKKKVGDVVSVAIPAGKIQIKIVKIS